LANQSQVRPAAQPSRSRKPQKKLDSTPKGCIQRSGMRDGPERGPARAPELEKKKKTTSSPIQVDRAAAMAGYLQWAQRYHGGSGRGLATQLGFTHWRGGRETGGATFGRQDNKSVFVHPRDAEKRSTRIGYTPIVGPWAGGRPPKCLPRWTEFPGFRFAGQPGQGARRGRDRGAAGFGPGRAQGAAGTGPPTRGPPMFSPSYDSWAAGSMIGP